MARKIPLKPVPFALPQSPSAPEHLWTVRQCAHYLQMTPAAVYKSAERGHIPHVKWGNHLRFDPVAVRAWIQQHSVAPNAPGWGGR